MQRDYLIALVAKFSDKAEAIVDALIEEGVVNAHFGNQEISEVIETFKQKFGTTRTSRYDRFAAKRLVDKHGAETVIQAITALSLLQSRDFAPSANNVVDIERKWPSIVKFLNGQRSTAIDEL